MKRETMNSRDMPDAEKLAKAVRDACLSAALEAYESAGISGLCPEGRWECATGAIKNVDLKKIIRALHTTDQPSGPPGLLG